MGYDARANIVRNCLTAPQFFPSCRVESQNQSFYGDGQLLLSGRSINQVRRIPGRVHTRYPPDLFSAAFVDCHQRAAFDARIDDHEILIQYWRSSTAPAVHFGADAGLPDLLAVQVKLEDATLAEEDVEMFAVGCRSCRGVAVIAHTF